MNAKAQKFQSIDQLQREKMKLISVNKEQLERLTNTIEGISYSVEELAIAHKDEPISDALFDLSARLTETMNGFEQLLESSQNTHKIHTKYEQNEEGDMRIKPETYQDLEGMRIIIEQLSSLTYYLTTHDEVDKEIAPALRHIHAHLHKLSENMQAALNEIEEASLEAIDEA